LNTHADRTDPSTQLVIPKVHGEKLTDIPDDHLTEILVREKNNKITQPAPIEASL
jgi:hypothetical protein